MKLDSDVASRQILLVEDERITRESLARLLRGRDYEVVLADSGSRAILEARMKNIGVVLMDIRLESEMDGIEAAKEIQRVQPLTSFIFVTAYAGDQSYRERVGKSRIRVGGWIEKPIQLNELVTMISKEFQKLSIRLDLMNARDRRGLAPADYLRMIAERDPSLSHEIVQELLDELNREEEVS